MLPDSDIVRLRHMLDAALEATGFARGHKRQDLKDDNMLSFALVRAIEIIGEAANQLSLETRKSYSQLPWQAIVGMRNRVVHAYFDIDLDRVWDTVKDDLPQLITELKIILAGEGIS